MPPRRRRCRRRGVRLDAQQKEIETAAAKIKAGGSGGRPPTALTPCPGPASSASHTNAASASEAPSANGHDADSAGFLSRRLRDFAKARRGRITGFGQGGSQGSPPPNPARSKKPPALLVSEEGPTLSRGDLGRSEHNAGEATAPAMLRNHAQFPFTRKPPSGNSPAPLPEQAGPPRQKPRPANRRPVPSLARSAVRRRPARSAAARAGPSAKRR